MLLAQSEDYVQIPYFASNCNIANDTERNSMEDDIVNISDSISDKNDSDISSISSNTCATHIAQDLYNRIVNLDELILKN